MIKSNFKLFIAFFLFFALAVVPMYAQVKVSGSVKDKAGDGLPGVNVLVKGRTSGTVTDMNGEFSIQASSKDVLKFSFIGYKNQEVEVGNKRVINVILEENAVSIEEVVVVAVGYGDVKRKDLTGSVAKANISEMMKAPVTSIVQALGGRISGVQVSSNDGIPGSSMNIVIRGNNSLTQSSAPLYVIDGFPMEESNASSLNPNDIESIDILKDASATAIYGARGANGVVIITTKSGKEGRPVVTYNGSVTMSKVSKTIDLMNGYEFVKLQDEITLPEDMASSYYQDGRTLESYRDVQSYDWQDEIFRTAITNNHYVSLTGKKDELKYAASLSATNQKGVIIASDFNRYQGRLNLDQKVNDKLSVSMNANYARSITNGSTPSTSSWSATNNLMYSVWGYRPVSPTGSDLVDELVDPDINMAEDYRFNPVLSAKNEYRKKINDVLTANLSLQYEFIKNLKLKVSGGYNLNDYRNEEFNGPLTRTGNTNPKNTQSKGNNAYLFQSQARTWLNENVLTYSYSKKNHNFNALAGVTFQGYNFSSNDITVNHITNASFGMAGLGKGDAPVVNSSLSENTMMSYLARLNYNYKSKYYLTLSYRADASSKFPESNRWGYFPSGSVAWNFSREEIMKNLNWLSNGKLRFSWGKTGNNRVSDFASLAKLYTGITSEYVYDNSYSAGYVLSSMANEQLKWETTEQFDLGLDLGFFNDRIRLTTDIYRKNTYDLLLNADLPPTSGFSSTYMNIGRMRNDGIEFTLETENIKNKNFQWTSNFNIAFNLGTIEELTRNQESMLNSVTFDTKYNSQYAYISMLGRPSGMMYGFLYDGTYKYDDFDVTEAGTYVLKSGIPNNTASRQVIQPGDPKYKDINGDGIINDNDRTIIGRGQAIHTGGFSNTFTYKNFDLNIFFQWSYGNDIYNANRMIFENPANRKNTNMYASYVNRWTPENPTSNMPRSDAQGSQQYSSLYVEDGSFLRLKSVSLGYTVPSDLLKRFGIKSAKFTLSAENLFTITNYSGFDPEVSVRHSALTPGFDYSAYPRSRSFSFGLNLSL